MLVLLLILSSALATEVRASTSPSADATPTEAAPEGPGDPTDHTVTRTYRVDGKTVELAFTLPRAYIDERLSYWEMLRAHYGVRDGSGGMVFWRRSRCADLPRCLYRDAALLARRDLVHVVEAFRELQEDLGLDPRGVARHVLGYVGEIPYVKTPGADEPFGMRSPLGTVLKGGDCDSKAVLTWVLLRELGIEAILIEPVGRDHVLVGVDVPGGEGESFLTVDGRRFLIAEVSVGGHPLGSTPEPLQGLDYRVLRPAKGTFGDP